MGIRAFAILCACLIFTFGFGASQSGAETRRALLIGNQEYKDGNIQQLRRSGKSTPGTSPRTSKKSASTRRTSRLFSISNRRVHSTRNSTHSSRRSRTGDTVFFYFSGHGFGVEADQNNYLLFTEPEDPVRLCARADAGERSEEFRR